MRKLILCLMPAVLSAAANGAMAQSRLPKCPGDYNAKTWTNCFGETTRPSGIMFAAEFRDGKPNGQGTATFPNGDKYIGQLKDGTPSGQGMMTWADGQKYVGEWRDGKMHGQGTRSWPEGKHVGGWKDNKRNGEGTEYRADGSVVQSGTWKDDALVRRR